jgi:hypothetical protein
MSTAPWDSLMRVFFDQAKLRERGEVVWAQVMQANSFLYAPGLNGESHAATVLHAGPEVGDPFPLSRVAARIVALANEPRNTPESKAAVAMMHPSRRKYWVPVPAPLAGGLEVYCSDLLIFRKLLPPEPKGATLRKQIFPLFVAPGETRMVQQVPYRFWPDEFVRFWESG